jgi:hypothetical protein
VATEPWLRGPIGDLHPVASHLIYTFQQAREELKYFTAGLTREQVWTQVAGASLGFHLRHIAGSVDRLAAYLEGRQLSEEQMRFLREEQNPGASLDELLRELESVFQRAGDIAKGLHSSNYFDPRFVGRKKLPTTAGGLIIHLSEHTQRHLGQAILTAKIVRGG